MFIAGCHSIKLIRLIDIGKALFTHPCKRIYVCRNFSTPQITSKSHEERYGNGTHSENIRIYEYGFSPMAKQP